MKKIGVRGLKYLKILHVFFVVVLFGGILISLVINMNIDFTRYHETHYGYKILILISNKAILHGTIATIIIAFIYGIFTNWGFFKHKWIVIKIILFVIQICIGLFVINKFTLDNMELLEIQDEVALTNPTFIHNQMIRQVALFLQVIITACIFIISYIKPNYKK